VTLNRRLRVTIALAASALAVLALAGCGQPSSPASSTASKPAMPAKADLSSPQAAVRSYLDWISYGYRIGSSEVASETMSGEEGVRIDSYIELNRQQGKRIDQKLGSISFGKLSSEGTRTLVPTHEVWSYSYVSAADGRPIGQANSATYDATYTLTPARPGQWLVDSVVVKPIGEVK
jgi:hypothetical protein